MIDHTALVKPQHLAAGDRLAAVSPSWGGPGTFPHRYEAGRRQLMETFDVEVVAMPNALRDAEWIAAHPEARADDLHAAFLDPAINGIVATIGGDDSIRVLPHLDLALIRSNPKVFLGFSDTTMMHMACLRAGLVSFYGPSIMAGFGENGGMFPYEAEGVRQVLFDPTPATPWPENRDGWTVEYLDWADPTNQSRARVRSPAARWRWLGGTPAQGPLVAGCLEVLDWLRGTPWWPDLDGAILAIETSEEQPSPEIVQRFLRSLVETGDLARLAGILFARPGGADLDPAEHGAYDAAITSIVREEQGLEAIPIVTGLDFGHTDPRWTMPIGMPVRVDPRQRQVLFLEPGVRRRDVR